MVQAETTAGGLAGLRVAVFESRMAGAMAELVGRQGGVPVPAGALREEPLSENPDALAFARGLRAGRFDDVILLTGVGARYLAEAVAAELGPVEWIEALRGVRLIVRGPKPQAVVRDWGLTPAVVAPEPNTWRELLAAIDAAGSVAGRRIAIQEYGQPPTELIEALTARGAVVTRVPVYRWALPDDLIALRQVVRMICKERLGAVALTSAQQVVHLFEIARSMRLESELRRALREAVIVASVGPTTSEALRAAGVEPDLVPDHPKMGHLVATLGRGWRQVQKAGRLGPAAFGASSPAEPTRAAPAQSDRLRESPFLRACRREPSGVTPIWLMRQAGRYMPEYRALRARVGFLELCRTPELAAEVTISAAEQLGVDAAILFADILLILEPLGFDLEFSRGEGPVIHNPVRTAADVDRLRPFDVEALGFVLDAVRLIRGGLRADLPLIGFAGAPFTLACYAIEGGGSRHYDRAKAFMYRDPGAWHALMERLTDATAAYLTAQAEAGAQALQLFDSWVGTLAPADYRDYVQPHLCRLFARLPQTVPAIHFGTGTGSLLELQRDAGGQVIGLDWRVDLDNAWDRLGPDVAVQGNLDPAVLLGPVETVRAQADRILQQAADRPGHIFNLGHGILPGTPVDRVRALVDYVHEASSR
ncbi:MAG: uroporphyrinogen decarboxylase [Isosphaeraceae bacterium]|jgi:uroporphyrinogen decarboxylase|nr:MAG: uroporphyrinogen decarboxylase [Isosphaeraceae bacterium]